ncbi:MAG TPA: phospholipase D-like domain-containing protein [Vicinamibacterales bacterium]|nr:phospholipase D-like domain-containing protein [Vicinamibacterales bacterium]
MSPHMTSGSDRSLYRNWLQALEHNDPDLHRELSARFDNLVSSPGNAFRLEAAASGLRGIEADDIAFETIVREGRPAFLIKDRQIVYQDALIEASAKQIVARLKGAAGLLGSVIPLVGRIDVANFPGNATYVGTGWLVDRDIVVTNRHVADLIAQRDGAHYRFRPGRFGDDMVVSLDSRHELGVTEAASVPVRRVLWIESEARKADIAFLQIGSGSVVEGRPPFIPLADADVAENTHVAVVGYPARAPAHIIPDQAWMDRIYNGTYDIKRIAPGLVGKASRGWATHDCTTLGGNSGSVVLDMKTGRAVALHFAGLYMVENYAVPASMMRQYLKTRPWHGGTPSPVPRPRPAPPEAPEDKKTTVAHASLTTDDGTISITIPLLVHVSLGQPQQTGGAETDAPRSDAEAAADALRQEQRGNGVLDAWAGYLIRDEQLSDDECIVVSAHPDRFAEVQVRMPREFRGLPVDVRPASLEEQLMVSAPELTTEATTSISYNDEDRTGHGFSFNWVNEMMELNLHIGPERSWTVLADFLAGTKKRLVTSMYEFQAAHIAKAMQAELEGQASLKMVLAPQSKDPSSGTIPAGEFDRSLTFDQWESDFGDHFDRIFVPYGANGLVANAYHIKVTVRDEGKDAVVWLSSGNWTKTSQPLIAPADLDNPSKTSKAGNREWHVVIANKTLADRFRNHIEADFEQAMTLGGTPEAVENPPLVDVPVTVLEAVVAEGPPAHVMLPKTITRKVRVKPLLTPDKQGAVYSNAVLQLIRSATTQLLFQNQYINMKGAEAGFLKKLVAALVDRSKTIADCRIILRSPLDGKDFHLSQLKRLGMDVHQTVRLLPNTHTKGIVVDGRRVLIGSHNWSSSGVTLNRDASLIFDDVEISQYYAETFELDWARAKPVTFQDVIVHESARMAIGDEPPAGFVRMTLSEYLES